MRRCAFGPVLVLVGTVVAELPRSTAPSAARDGIDAVKTWAKTRVSQATDTYVSRFGPRMPSPEAWEDLTVYQIMLDRFSNGDVSNDRANIQGAYGSAQGKYQDTHSIFSLPQYSHGGDIRGTINRLPYLSELGVTALYFNPLYGHNGAYHGYCQADLTIIDPNFGTADDFRELVNKSHALGMRIIMDVVVNHMCAPSSGKTLVTWPGSGSQAERDMCQAARNDYDKEHIEFVESLSGSIEFGDDFFPPLDSQAFYNRCGQYDLNRGEHPGRQFGDFAFTTGYDINLNNECQTGYLDPDGAFQCTGRDHLTLLDMDGNNPDLREIFTDLMIWWIAEYDVDAFRIDAVPHVTTSLLAYFSTHVRHFAHSIGKDFFLTTGEVVTAPSLYTEFVGNMDNTKADGSNIFAADQTNPVAADLVMVRKQLEPFYTPKYPYPGLQAVYNFEYANVMKDVLHDEAAKGRDIAYQMAASQNVPSPFFLNQEVCPACFIYISIHDQPRFLNTLKPGQQCNAETVMANSLTILLIASAGLPILYYGDEQGFSGNCRPDSSLVDTPLNMGVTTMHMMEQCAKNGGYGDDAWFRQDMFDTGPFKISAVVPSVRNLQEITPNWCYDEPPMILDDPFLRRDHAIFKAAKHAIALRNSCDALRRGRLAWLSPEQGVPDEVMGVSRVYEPSKSEIFVFINRIKGSSVKPSQSQITMQSVQLICDVDQCHVGDYEYVDVWNDVEPGKDPVSARVNPATNQLVFEAGGLVLEAGQTFVFVQKNRTILNTDRGQRLCTDAAIPSGPVLPPQAPNLPWVKVQHRLAKESGGICCGTAAYITDTGQCGTNTCKLRISFRPDNYTNVLPDGPIVDAAVYARPAFASFPETIPAAAFKGTSIAGIFSADLTVQNNQRLVYYIDVNGEKQLNDRCAMTEGPESPWANWSYIDVKCDPDACHPFESRPDLMPLDAFAVVKQQIRASRSSKESIRDAKFFNTESGDRDRLMDDVSEQSSTITIAQLHFWRYADVAAECERMTDIPGHEYSSFSAVEVLPANSAKMAWPDAKTPSDESLHSFTMADSGALQSMVETCTKNGVQVFVAIELNSVLPSSDPVNSPDYHNPNRTCAMALPIANYTPFAYQQCRLETYTADGRPAGVDRATSSERVKLMLAHYLDRYLMVGVAGFRVGSAYMLSVSDLKDVLGHISLLRPATQYLTGRFQAIFIWEPWPYQLLQDPSLQPPKDFPLNALMQPSAYLDIISTSYVADTAWSLNAGRAILCGRSFSHGSDRVTYPACSPGEGLLDITMKLNSPNFASEPVSNWWSIGQATSRARVALNLNKMDFSAFAFDWCTSGSGMSVPCPKVPNPEYMEGITDLANTWLMALPGGPVSVFDSYSWRRQWQNDTKNYPLDDAWATGPPRDGPREVPMNCYSEARTLGDSGELTDGGNRWHCEHRFLHTSGMGKWRREVVGSSNLIHLVGSDGYVAFGRSVEVYGARRRAGWIFINFLDDNETASTLGSTWNTGLPAGQYGFTYSDTVDERCESDDKYGILTVDWRGRIVGGLEGVSLHLRAITISTSMVTLSTSDSLNSITANMVVLDNLGVSIPIMVVIVAALFAFAIICGCLYARMWRVTGVETRLDPSICQTEWNAPSAIPAEPAARSVLMSCLEHVVVPLKIKVVAGGLGNVAEFYTQMMPVQGFFVFPMLKGPDYSAFTKCDYVIQLPDTTVEVFQYTEDGSNCTFLALRHELYMERTKANIYPDGRAPQHFMIFMSLWNRSVAFLLRKLHAEGKVDLFHSLDYHTALAPIYLEAEGGPMLPVALTLHNALYQGSLLDTLDSYSWEKVERLLQLPNARYYTQFEGDFNMLHAVVSYMHHHQRGEAAVGVSHRYGHSVELEIPLFKGVAVGGHPNPMLESRRPDLPGGPANLMEHKAECKAKVQEELGFDIDPDAVLFSFVGRWTHEKGLDLLADAVPSMLDRHPTMQIYLCGPIGDPVGQYAATKLVALSEVPALRRRLLVKAEFYRVTEDMRFAADFTICPSRTEPFGYVDVEYAWHGTPTIGSMVGGLGKVPGIYYRVLDPSDRPHTLHQLNAAVDQAMAMRNAHDDQFERACKGGLEVSFPPEKWAQALEEQYLVALKYTGKMKPRKPIWQSKYAKDIVKGGSAKSDKPLDPPKTSLPDTSITFKMQGSLPNKMKTTFEKALREANQLASSPKVLEDSKKSDLQRLKAAHASMRFSTRHHLSLTEDSDGEGEDVDANVRQSRMSKLEGSLDADALDKNVAKLTMAGNFLGRESITSVEQILEQAYVKSKLTMKRLPRLAGIMHQVLMQPVLAWDLNIFNLLLCCLCICVPIGSIGLITLTLYAAPNTWTMTEIATLFSIFSGATAVGAFCWMQLSRVIPLNYLCFFASLPQTALVPILVFGVDPSYRDVLYGLAALYGFGCGALEPLYIGFNYAEQWASNKQIAALRMGLVEPWRHLFSFVVVGMLTTLVPENNKFTVALNSLGEAPDPKANIPIGILIFFCVIATINFLCGCVALMAPAAETMSLLPSVRLNVFNYQSYSLLILSDCVTRLGSFLDLVYVAWMLMAGWDTLTIANLFYTVAVVGALVLLMFCMMLYKSHGTGTFVLLAIAVCSFNPSIIGSYAALSTSQWEGAGTINKDAGPNTALMLFFGMAIILSGLKRTASSLLVLYSLPSRFKYITFQGYAGLLQHGCAAASPWLILSISKWWDLPYETNGDWARTEVFATSTVYMLLPFSCISFAINLASLVPLANEGIVPWFNVVKIEDKTAPTGKCATLKRILQVFRCQQTLRFASSNEARPSKESKASPFSRLAACCSKAPKDVTIEPKDVQQVSAKDGSEVV